MKEKERMEREDRDGKRNGRKKMASSKKGAVWMSLRVDRLLLSVFTMRIIKDPFALDFLFNLPMRRKRKNTERS